LPPPNKQAKLTVQYAKAGLGVPKLTPDVSEQFGLELKRGGLNAGASPFAAL